MQNPQFGAPKSSGGGSAGITKRGPSLIDVQVSHGNIRKGRIGLSTLQPALYDFAVATDLGAEGDVPLPLIGTATAALAGGEEDVQANLLVKGPSKVLSVFLDADAAVTLGDGTATGVMLRVFIDAPDNPPITVTGQLVFGGASGIQEIRVNADIPAGLHNVSVELVVEAGTSAAINTLTGSVLLQSTI